MLITKGAHLRANARAAPLLVKIEEYTAACILQQGRPLRS